jgi:hypothetical protein
VILEQPGHAFQQHPGFVSNSHGRFPFRALSQAQIISGRDRGR